MRNSTQLAYWRLNGYTVRDVAETFSAMDGRIAVRLDFASGALNLSLNERAREHGHILAVVLPFFGRLVESGKLPDGSLICCLEDGAWESFSKTAPTIGFGRKKTDYYTLLMPDTDFIGSSAYTRECEELDWVKSKLPWQSRIEKAFWRGSSTGGGLDSERWRDNPRVRLAMLSREYEREGIIDACLSGIVQCREESSRSRILESGIVGAGCPFSEFLKYKYLIDIDGNSCAWRSCFLKLYSGSVVLKVESDNMEWYYGELLPWEHYIPVKQDLSDLIEKIKWAKSHDLQCQEISERALEFVNRLRKEDPVAQTAQIVCDVLSCQRG